MFWKCYSYDKFRNKLIVIKIKERKKYVIVKFTWKEEISFFKVSEGRLFVGVLEGDFSDIIYYFINFFFKFGIFVR